MRILVVQESDWIEKGPHQSHHLLERLSNLGHEIRVIDYEIDWRNRDTHELFIHRKEMNPASKSIQTGNIRVIRPSAIRLPIIEYFFLIISHSFEIRRQIKECRPDMIIGFSILNSFMARIMAKSNRIPFVYYVIDELHRLLPSPKLQRVARQFERMNMKNADIVISINEALRDYTISMGARKEKTEIIRAGIDLKKFLNVNEDKRREIRKDIGAEDEDTILFFMGWLYSFSGLDEVAREIISSRSVTPHIKLLIVGKGELRKELEEIVAKDEHQIGKITLIDWVPYTEIPSYLQASDICILPSRNNEIMKNIVPIKIYEYMAAGKPVICTELPGVMREFGSDNGVIYVKNPIDIVHRSVEISRDIQLQRLGERAQEFVKKNDWSKIVKEFEVLLERLNNRETNEM